MDIFSGYVYDLCMMPVMVKEADLYRIEVPKDYERLPATVAGFCTAPPSRASSSTERSPCLGRSP